MQSHWQKIAVLAALAGGCAGATPPPNPDNSNATTVGELHPPSAVEDAASPRGPLVTEAVARGLLAEPLRQRGIRVLHDVNVVIGSVAVTLDGFDPERLVGFEYIDPREATALAGLSPGLWRQGGQTILIVAATDRSHLEDALGELLAALPSGEARPD